MQPNQSDHGAQLIRAALYIRMSTEHQQYSTENEADAIREYAEARGYEIVRTYADHGKSGLRVEGREGLRELLDDVQSGRAEFEAILVYDISRCTIATATVSPTSGSDDSEVASTHKARVRLTGDFHLAPSEAESLLALAQQRALEGMAPGEQLRSMLLLGLDDLARRAANSLDLGAEIAARRLFAQVSGVTRSVPEDTAQEFLQVIKRGSARQDAEAQLQGHTIEALPPARARRCEEVEPMVLEASPEGDDRFDADALADFDRENG